jgi:hypothetical protein
MVENSARAPSVEIFESSSNERRNGPGRGSSSDRSQDCEGRLGLFRLGINYRIVKPFHGSPLSTQAIPRGTVETIHRQNPQSFWTR